MKHEGGEVTEHARIATISMFLALAPKRVGHCEHAR
jgi:hypothetical protein